LKKEATVNLADLKKKNREHAAAHREVDEHRAPVRTGAPSPAPR
jgi:hypothetical protein